MKMALLTRTGIDKILKRIYETGGMTEDMEKDIERLRADFDEREGILKRYGETYDGEDKDEYEFEDKDLDRTSSMNSTEDMVSREEYEKLRKRYIDRFFGGREYRDETDDILRETKEDVERDGEKQTYEELFERREG